MGNEARGKILKCQGSAQFQTKMRDPPGLFYSETGFEELWAGEINGGTKKGVRCQ